MLKKISFFIYLLFIFIVSVCGVLVAYVNSEIVTVDYVVDKINLTLAAVFGLSLLVGFIFASILWLWLVIKLALKSHILFNRTKNLQRKIDELELKLNPKNLDVVDDTQKLPNNTTSEQ
ncbi:MAG: LapA family protein [Succinivibrionaceae bacterium]